KGRPGISAAARERVREVTEAAPDATVLLFSHPRLAHEVPTARNLLAAWGGEGVMQEAVAAWLLGEKGGTAGGAAGGGRWEGGGGGGGGGGSGWRGAGAGGGCGGDPRAA